MKNYLTTKDLGDYIVSQLKEKNLLPDIIDYTFVSQYDAKPICDTEYQVIGYPSYGGNEGIYLNFRIKGNFGFYDEELDINFLTIKTLYDSEEAMRTMCILLSECLKQANLWHCEKHNELIRKGYTCKKDKTSRVSCIAYTVEEVVRCFNSGYTYIFDNENQVLVPISRVQYGVE